MITRFPHLRRTRYIVLIAALALALVPSAAAGGANHPVIALATADGSALNRSGVQVAPFAGDSLNSANLAIATSTACTGCRAVAVAFQAVLVTGNPNVVTPANVAAATTAGCTACFSYAFAYQYVLSTNGPAHLSLEGQARTAEIRGRAADLAASDLAPEVLTERLDALADEFKAVIDEELVGAGTGAVSRRVSVDTPA